MSFTEQNSIIPSDKQYDEHFAHRCVDCHSIFSKHLPVAGDCEEGDLCQDCFDSREIEASSKQVDFNPFTVLHVYNSAAQYCNDNLQGDPAFLTFVMKLPHRYLDFDLNYLHVLFTDKHFTP
jgi:hypothetical protein